MVSLPPGSSLGRYRVVEQIGRGGMATVFRALDPNLDRYIAVKVLPSYYTDDPTFVERFAQEAQTVARLRHANILQIYDFGDDKGFTYIVTELVTGGTLQDKLGVDPLSTEETLRLMGPLADGLDYAHSQGIIHRDLKPANVLLGDNDIPILADFGLARMLEASIRFTQASQALGTPEYMSPEQAMGADADHRSDLYAFGVMLYQMLVGQTPFRADTPAATLMAHVHKAMPLPTLLNSNIAPRIEAILLKGLAKNPEDRFQSAKDMITALTMAGGPPGPMPDDTGSVTAVMDAAGPGAGATEEMTTPISPEAVSLPTVRLGAGEAAVDSATEAIDVAEPAEGPTAAPPSGKARFPMRAMVAAGAAIIAVVAGGIALATMSGSDDAPETPPVASAPVAPASPATESVAPAPVAAAAPIPPTAVPTPEPTVVPTPAATPVPTIPPIDILSALPGIMDEAEDNILKLRKFEVAPDVNADFKSRADLEEITRGFFRRQEVRQQVFEAQELYKALGLMAEEEDLEEILTRIQNQQVLALFDDQTESVYVMLDEATIGPKGKLTYGMAYMAAVQQELFNIADIRNRTRAAGSDYFRAANALVQGDVAQVSSGFIATVLTGDEARVVREPIPDSELMKAPRIVVETVLFPVVEGADFVAELFGVGEWEAINDAYANPPVSTEQVLHPEMYFEGEEPQLNPLADISPGLGRGWNEVSNDVMGEFLVRAYLEEYLDADQAAAAAEGWGGDRYSVLNGPLGERLFVSLLRRDTFEDAAEFFDGYRIFMGVKYQGVEGVSTQGNQSSRTWKASDEAVFIGRSSATVFLIIGESTNTVGNALELVEDSLAPAAPGPTPITGAPRG